MSQFDFIEREISGMVRMIAHAIFNKTPATEELFDEEGNLSGEEFLRYTVFRLLSEGNVNEAENILHEAVEREGKTHLSLALDFYQKLNSYSDQALGEADFSREEIAEGLREIKRICGLE